jgi:hypothetical protein
MNETVTELLDRFVSYIQDGDFLDGDILSLYLAVDPADLANQATTPAWRIFVKTALAEIEQGVAPADRPRWARARGQVETYLADAYRPAGKTLVLFASDAGLLDYHLPVTLESRAYYGLAQIKHFLWAVDEYQEYDVILFAQDQVRYTSVFLGRATDDLVVQEDQTRIRAERKSGHEANYAQRQDEIDRRFLREAAGEIERYVLEHNAVERLVFGGNARLAHATRKLLHPRIADLVVGVLPLPFESTAQEIARATRDLAERVERDSDRELVAEVIDRAGRGERGAVGTEAVGRALDMQAVRTLALPYPIPAETADGLFIRAVRSSSDLRFVYGEAADRLRAAGDVGALLYYTLPDAD